MLNLAVRNLVRRPKKTLLIAVLIASGMAAFDLANFILADNGDNVEELAGRYGWGGVSGHMRTLADDLHMWSNVDAAAVAHAAATCLTPEQMGFVCIGPWRDADRQEVEELLHQLI